MSLFYKKHIFFCTNIRQDKNKRSCGSKEVLELRNYMKEKIKDYRLQEEFGEKKFIKP